MNQSITIIEKKAVNDIINNFEIIKKKLTKLDYTHHREKFFLEMKKFRKYLASLDESLFTFFYHSKFYDKYKTYFRDQNNYYIRALESAEAFSIMTHHTNSNHHFIDLINRDFIKNRYKTKATEISLLNTSNANTLVMVWSWPMPETIIYFNENTNIKNIIWLDYNQEAIYIWNELINSLQINNIKLIHKNALDYNYAWTDIIHIAIFVSPKDEILAKIAETADENVQISIESPTWFYKMLYDDVYENINKRLKIIKRQWFSNPYIKSEILLLKKHNDL